MVTSFFSPQSLGSAWHHCVNMKMLMRYMEPTEPPNVKIGTPGYRSPLLGFSRAQHQKSLVEVFFFQVVCSPRVFVEDF